MSKRKRNTSREAHGTKKRMVDHTKREALTDHSIQHGSLQLVYSKVQPLRDYILNKLPPTSRTRRRRVATFDQDLPEHTGFLDSTLIGVQQTSSQDVQSSRSRELRAFTQTQRSTCNVKNAATRCDVVEVLSFVIWQLFQRVQHTSRRPDHLLCHGYGKAVSVAPDDRSNRSMTIPGILEQWPNACIETFKTSPWPEVLSLLGDDFENIFSSLLFDCGIFTTLKVGKDNMFQLSGQPIFNIAKPANHGSNGKMSKKDASSPISEPRKPGQITFVRSRMLYARPSVGRNGSVQLGLKHIHVLNRYAKSGMDTQRLRTMQYIFPRQFGLHNVFTSSVNTTETAQSFKDYTVRDEEIMQSDKSRNNKVPKRLRFGADEMIQNLVVKHHRCSYTQLLYHYTERRASAHSRLAQKGAMPLKRSSDSVHGHVSTADTSLLGYAISQSNVSAFCRAVLQKLIPFKAFGTGMGGQVNWETILTMVNHFVTARRFESFTLHEVVHSLRISTIDWLRPANIGQGQKLSISDRRKRLELLHEFVYFLFDSLLIPLIRSNFYVTETAVHRNRLFYFRHDVWKKISEPSLMALRLNMFEPLNARQLKHALQTNKLGCSQVRLLPKENGVRPITNLRRRAMLSINGKRLLGSSINTKLAPTFSIFNFERLRQPESIASALFSVVDIGRRLHEFQQLHANAGVSGAKSLHFVKMDIKSCFDTIPQQQLLILAHRLLKEDDYRVTRHVESKRLSNSSRKDKAYLTSKFVSSASETVLEPAFLIRKAEESGSRKSRVLFTGTDHHRVVRTDQIRQLLKDHLTNNIVRIGRRHFRQTQGISQGSVLSSLLCSFFYTKFQHDKLGFLDAQSSLLLRLIDDFLLITTNQNQAHTFVNAMSEGYAEYGISINAAKSLANFEVSVKGHKIPRVHGSQYFPYCGLGIHMKSLELSKDRQRKDVYVENALTIDISGRAVVSLQRRVLSALKVQMHAMLLDVSHNSPSQIMTTLFGCYVEATMKLHQYRINLPRCKRPGSHLVASLCQQMLKLGDHLLKGLPANKQASIRDISVPWIGSLAMMQVLSRKQTEYEEVLRTLREVQVRSQRHSHSALKGLDSIAREGIAPFQDYIY